MPYKGTFEFAEYPIGNQTVTGPLGSGASRNLEPILVKTVEINSPTPEMLANKLATYQDTVTNLRYQTNGTALVTTGINNLPAVALGTGSSTLTSAANGNRHNYWTGSSVANLTLSATGAGIGDIIEIANDGSAVITMLGVTAATGYINTISPGVIGGAEYTGGTWKSVTPSLASVIASVSGTASVGSVLTCTPAANWTGTFQWTNDGANIAAATASTYTLVAGDAGHAIGCKFGPTTYATNTIAIPAAKVLTYRNSISTTDGTAILTGSIDIGTASADRLVIVATHTGGNTKTLTSIVVNGVTLTVDKLLNAQINNTMVIASGIVAAGAGAQTVTVTWSAGGFQDRELFLWTATGLNSTVKKNTAQGDNGPAAVIAVDAADVMVALQIAAATNTLASSTEAPVERLDGLSVGLGANWVIVATNASFTVQGGGGNRGSIVTSYA